MLTIRAIAEVLGRTEAEVRRAIRSTKVQGVKARDLNRRYYGSDAIDRIKDFLANN